jgi:drug/metabolite transporter (DMT)-like permease
VLIGVVWQLSTRAAASGALRPVDLMLVRYVTPALLLAPLLLRWGFWPKAMPNARAAWAVASGGLLYGLCSFTGARYAPVAHMGALVPGTIPVFVAILAWLIHRQAPTARVVAALGALCAGVVLVSAGGQAAAAFGASSSVLFGDVLFLLAAAVWATYTLSVRGSTMQPLHWVALVAFWNAPVAALIWWLTPDTLLRQAIAAQPGFVAWQVLIQGVFAAIGGNWMFLATMKRLGAVTASATGAAVPAGVAIGGVWLLGESVAPMQMLGIGLTGAGIWAASVWGARR